ncbi:dihydrodipicolinate synthase family protein [Paracoccus sp. (in: a-proteobacteria)]|uniref:dihydrodipicolinate synthase family protein n=1 Tax=Paracoccus sp. TaxID=267 RepID=UPI0028A0DCC5|nr:dihydrodipicolinate synthase family protein [Paracoccus sp. (in: a-proteobacteria)]
MELGDYRRVLHGISGVHATAYGTDGEIDAALTANIVDSIAASGVHNIVSGGNTGEFYSLTMDEVIRLQAIAVEANNGRAAVTAAAGRSLRDAIRLGREAAKNGCDGVMVHHPLDPFAAPHEQVNYFIGVAEAIDLPVVAYVRSDAIPVADLVRLATHPRIVGVKFASNNTLLFADCTRETRGSDATWICGLAETWALPFYALGGKGFTSGLVNVAPERSLAVWKALEGGDFARARAIIDSIAEFENLRTLYRNGANVTVVKEALQIRGLTVGAPRVPNLTRLAPQDRAKLERIVASWATDGLV